ncbi:uncharacterized protein [Arachis hypogaea]|uniref:uncharacterized protein isoform X2 n=1 Tax=Arachis hypogaea TaxID=3818 RepID=UPI003B20F009
MEKVDEGLKKIFLPVNENNTHWYLVVFDLCNHQTILLDSLPIATDKEQKRLSIVKLVNDGTRIRLALDLILRPHNLMLR